jgi:hypothetical protein
LDFSLLKPSSDFSLGVFGESLKREVASFGFEVEFDHKVKSTQIESAFLKTNTHRELLVIEADKGLVRGIHPRQSLKIKIEVDTDPPAGFLTETRYVLMPIPFSVRSFCLPDLFAGKLHAVLCRRWKSRVKGRDWYDLVWYAAHHPEARLLHLESRMRQTGDYAESVPLAAQAVFALLRNRIDFLDVEQVRREVAPFVRDRRNLEAWSTEFFHDVASRIELI